MEDLFSGCARPRAGPEVIGAGAMLLRGRALPSEGNILRALDGIIRRAPFRHMVTPSGFRMSVAMTSCGIAGWVTDRAGYRYDQKDPESGSPWPAMPTAFSRLAAAAAAEAGYQDFAPDSCLINRYEPGARLSLHQDRDERDFTQPIVSVTLGLPATFQFGGPKRTNRVQKFALFHGDIAVWGGPSRLYHHGILAVKEGNHPIFGRTRINLTFRRAL